MEYNLANIASHFNLDSAVTAVNPMGEGFINDTFTVECTSGTRYILQRKNDKIFTDVPKMMDNIYRVTEHLKGKISAMGGDPLREALTVIKTNDDTLYHQEEDGSFWAVALFIEDTITYQAARTTELSFQGGLGIGKFQKMLADFDERLYDILPGFHNMRFRFEQWDKAIKDDLAGRVSSLKEEIEWIESRREVMMALWEKAESGEIPTRITHNDTKISNILFNKEGEVLCVIDLDTVLSSIVLNDYGDAMRCFTNSGDEDDKDLSRVTINLDIFEAYTAGYLSEAAGFLTAPEVENLAFSAKYITFEQVLRFLMDYINGDTYYKIKYPDHNLVRTHAQYKLLESMEENFDKMEAIVKQEYEKYSN